MRINSNPKRGKIVRGTYVCPARCPRSKKHLEAFEKRITSWANGYQPAILIVLWQMTDAAILL